RWPRDWSSDVCSSDLFTARRTQIVGLAARDALPTIYGQREFMAAGGLMSYATDLKDAYRQAGVYSGKILCGAQPSELPVVQSARSEERRVGKGRKRRG